MSHIVVKNFPLIAIVPFDSYSRPILFNDAAKVGCHCPPTNAVANFEKSGLLAGHFVWPNALLRQCGSYALATDRLHAMRL